MNIENAKKNWCKPAWGIVLCLLLSACLAVGETVYNYAQSPKLSSVQLLVLFFENWRDWLRWEFNHLVYQALLKCLM